MCDQRFLPQALVLHRSLERHASSFRLQVLCMDAVSERFFRDTGLDGVETVSLAELEKCDPELTAVKRNRTWLEYCWTATPCFCRLALDRARTGSVVAWVDADVEFLRDPDALLDELADGSILLTPHEYYRPYPTAAPASWLTEQWGRFNGGTIAFRRDEQGSAAVALWRARSVAWCHDRTEPGLFGNQLHLVDFPVLFPATRLLQVPGGGLGPWNAGQYAIARNGTGISADGRPVTFYHHQSLRLYRRPRHLRPLRLPSNFFPVPGHGGALVARARARYRISRADRRLIWKPYIRRLAEAVAAVAGEAGASDEQFDVLTLDHVRQDVGVRIGLRTGRVTRQLRWARRALGVARAPSGPVGPTQPDQGQP
jgi:hypothetical protein